MSTTKLYTVFKTKQTFVAKYSNSWGSAPALWDYMGQKYLGLAPNSWMFGSSDIWKLHDKARVPEHLRATLLATFDMAIIPQDMAAVFADSFQKTHQEILSETSWTWTHWGAIAKDIREHSKKLDKRALGFGIGCTSVSDPWEEDQKHINEKQWIITKSDLLLSDEDAA